jgi:hypothetical protein
MARKKKVEETNLPLVTPVDEPKAVEFTVETGIKDEVKKLTEAVDKLTLIVCRMENRLNMFGGGYN